MSLKKSGLKPRSENGAFASALPFEDENRIDWERRRKARQASDDADQTVFDDAEDEELASWASLAMPDDADDNGRNGKQAHRKKSRKKGRHLVMDEDSGRVVLKRRRKQNRAYNWHEDDE